MMKTGNMVEHSQRRELNRCAMNVTMTVLRRMLRTRRARYSCQMLRSI